MVSANYEHRQKRSVSYPVLALVCSLLAYAAFFSWQSWQDAKNEGTRQLATIAGLGGKALDSYFAGLEISLRSLSKDLVGSRKQLDLGRAFTLVSQFQARHSELESVILMRANGQLLMTGDTPYNRELPSLGDVPSFGKLHDELEKAPFFFIGHPASGHIDNSWVIPARYGVTDQTGKLIYIFSANLSINLVQLYLADSVQSGTTSFGLVRDDGYMVSVYPAPETARLNETYAKPVAGAMFEYLHAGDKPQSGQNEGTVSVIPDGSILVMQRLQHYPLTLFAEMPVAEIRTLWWRRVRVSYFLMVLMLAGTLAIQRSAFRRHKVWSKEQRRETLRHNYEHSLLEHSSNEIYMFDADSLLFTYANDYALNSLGYTLEELKKRTFLSLHPELGIETFATLIAPLRLGERESVKYQTVQARADGSNYPVEINLQLFTSDVRNGCLAIINDITALRQAEENIWKFSAPVERRTSGRQHDWS